MKKCGYHSMGDKTKLLVNISKTCSSETHVQPNNLETRSKRVEKNKYDYIDGRTTLQQTIRREKVSKVQNKQAKG